MPGIFGFVANASIEESVHQLNNMANTMLHYPHLQLESQFSEHPVYGAKTHINAYPSMDYSNGQLYVWFDGIVHNLPESCLSVHSTIEHNPAVAIANAFTTGKLYALLAKLDGAFNAVLYDKSHKKLLLINERFGMRNLYYSVQQQGLAWAAEVKGLLAMDKQDKSWNPESFHCFMELGYLLEDNTWFKKIKLLQPATVLEYNLSDNSHQLINYWQWSAIQPRDISFNDAVDSTAELMIQAVKNCFQPSGKTGIPLSGGLDSRLLFAIVNKLYPEYQGYAYTFGQQGCSDIEIAQQVIKKAPHWQHHIYHLTTDNWFYPRFKKILDTDGMLDMQHMHGSEFLADIANSTPMSLSGYCGDAILGGSLLKKDSLDTRINHNNAHAYYGPHTALCDITNPQYDIAHTEPHIYMNRVRRFTNMGLSNGQFYQDCYRPFFSNDIVEFVLSIPDHYRLENKLYGTMLARHFPDYFLGIPWQKTGWPVSEKCPAGTEPLAGLQKYQAIQHKEYIDYGKLIREPDIRSVLIETLGNRNAKYKEFTDTDYFNDFVMRHMNTPVINRCNKILRLLTCEIYFNKALPENK